MEQRRPRVGDVVDDYCPRERRLANHVVVAMVGDEVKQTRCTTCDTEHPYKHAKVPPRRKPKPQAGALVTTGADPVIERPRLNGDAASSGALATAAATAVAPAPAAPPGPTPSSTTAPAPAAPAALPVATEQARGPADDGPVHRPLIRATLPRPEGEVKERPLPDFTLRAIREFRKPRSGGARSAGKRLQHGVATFQPGVMSFWSRSNPRGPGGRLPAPPGGGPHHRPQGRKKSR